MKILLFIGAIIVTAIAYSIVRFTMEWKAVKEVLRFAMIAEPIRNAVNAYGLSMGFILNTWKAKVILYFAWCAWKLGRFVGSITTKRD